MSPLPANANPSTASTGAPGQGRRQPRPALQGAGNSQAKLSESDVLEIRAARGLVPGKALARIFGVSISTISLIQRRQRWAHV